MRLRLIQHLVRIFLFTIFGCLGWFQIVRVAEIFVGDSFCEYRRLVSIGLRVLVNFPNQFEAFSTGVSLKLRSEIWRSKLWLKLTQWTYLNTDFHFHT